jgi:hypothetical protein
MSRQISELEGLLRQLVTEHQRLLQLVNKHETAMKAFDLRAMDDLGREQDASRLRIVGMDQRRRLMVTQIGKSLNLQGEPTLKQIAALQPEHAKALLALRTDLKQVIEQISLRTFVGGKVASAVLGHLNMVVRLVAGAVERAGLYTKSGIPKMSARIGGLEAVG